MVTSISLGNFSTVNGKNVLAGSQSGIDTTSLINALAAAKAQPATNDQTKITANQAQVTAYNQLKTLLTNLQNSLDGLRNPNGVTTSGATDVFDARDPFVSITGGLTASDYVGVQTSNGAPIGNYTIQVDHLATAESLQSGTFTSRSTSIVNASPSNTAGTFAAGTFTINGINVTLNQGNSLNDVAAAINSVSSQSNVTASIVALSGNSYELVLTGTKTGAANAIKISDPNGVLPTVGTPPANTTTDPVNLPAGQTMFGVKQGAGDAQFEFNDQTISRSTNTITDLLDNTTISLYAPTNGQTVSLSIDKDDKSIATAIGSFVDSYNAIRTFIAQQQQRNASGNLVSGAVLSNDPTLNTIANSLSAMISGQLSIAIPSAYSSGQTNAPVRLGDLGLTLTDQPKGTTTDSSGNTVNTPEVDNIISLDPSTLSTNLDSYFDQVRQLFEFSFTASTSNINIYSRDNTVANSNFSIAVDTSQPVGQQAKITSIDSNGLVTAIPLQYSTTTTMQSSPFGDANTNSIVGASGSNTPGMFSAGTINLNGVTVTLNEGDTLQDVVNDINNTVGTGITASIASSGSSFMLSLIGTAQGTNGINITSDNTNATSLLSTTKSNSFISGMPNTDLAKFTVGYSGNGNETITRSSGINTKDFALSIDTTRPAGSQAQITQIFGATLVTPINMNYNSQGGSTLITGNSGTPFAGLQMLYTGTGQDNINIAINQGTADQMFNNLNSILNGVATSRAPVIPTGNGTVDGVITNLTSQDTDLQNQIGIINTQVSTYKTQLQTKFANMEAAIGAANQLLQLLQAQDNAALVNSGH